MSLGVVDTWRNQEDFRVLEFAGVGLKMLGSDYWGRTRTITTPMVRMYWSWPWGWSGTSLKTGHEILIHVCRGNGHGWSTTIGRHAPQISLMIPLGALEAGEVPHGARKFVLCRTRR